jgi:hypothetical protein
MRHFLVHTGMGIAPIVGGQVVRTRNCRCSWFHPSSPGKHLFRGNGSHPIINADNARGWVRYGGLGVQQAYQGPRTHGHDELVGEAGTTLTTSGRRNRMEGGMQARGPAGIGRQGRIDGFRKRLARTLLRQTHEAAHPQVEGEDAVGRGHIGKGAGVAAMDALAFCVTGGTGSCQPGRRCGEHNLVWCDLDRFKVKVIKWQKNLWKNQTILRVNTGRIFSYASSGT